MDSQTTSDEQKTGWAFKPEQAEDSSAPAKKSSAPKNMQNQSVSWTASEFVANHKTAGWYLALFIVIFAVAGLTFVLTGDWISSTTIVVVGSLFAVLAGRKPRQLGYQLDSKGITIGEKFYPFSMFKSFAIMEDGAIGCINLMPLKRFMPDISVYYPPEEENKIINVLTGSLPNDQREEHGFDRLMKKIRF